MSHQGLVTICPDRKPILRAVGCAGRWNTAAASRRLPLTGSKARLGGTGPPSQSGIARHTTLPLAVIPESPILRPCAPTITQSGENAVYYLLPPGECWEEALGMGGSNAR